jgi:hypothetical protein
LLATLVVGQPTLTREKNAPREGDALVKQQVKYVSPGRSGQLVIWNFGQLTPVNASYGVSHRGFLSRGNESRVAAVEHHTQYHYNAEGDTLQLLRQENATGVVDYEQPEVQLSYPFTYGSRVSQPFRGAGRYSRSQPLSVAGTTEVSGDAYGLLVTPSGDTLRNILRVKTTRRYKEVAKGESDILLEKYAWYMGGYRYPVFETVKTSTVRPGSPVAEYFTTAFYYPPQAQHYLPLDMDNEEDRQVLDEELFAYHSVHPNPCKDYLQVEYNVAKLSRVSVRLYNLQGQLQRVLVDGELQDLGSYVEEVNMNSYAPGVYLVKLTVGDREYVKKVVKQ